MGHHEADSLLTKHQYGFHSKECCFTPLLEYFEDLKTAIDEVEGVTVIFLDCKKSFDTVPCKDYLQKFKLVGG